MLSQKKKNGFTIIELLISASIMIVLISMGAFITNKYFNRRAIDKITFDLSSALNLAKLSSAREGVEYQTECVYSSESNTLTVQTKRGNSNIGTNFDDEDNYEVVFNETMRIDPNYTIDSTEFDFQFNPNGTSTDLSVNIAPTETANVNKCGRLEVSPLGRISTIIGNWDADAVQPCVRIADTQDEPAS